MKDSWFVESNKEMKDRIKDLNERKTPIVKIDNRLKSYLSKPLFEAKVERANEVLRTVGLPNFTKLDDEIQTQ